VAGVVNPKNELISYRYTAYGDLAPSSPTPCVYGYNAEDTDYSTGLQYLRARYYEFTMGRFVQKDEFKGDFTRPKTFNRYTYCYNSPVILSDPSGYIAMLVAGLIGAAVGAVVGAATEIVPKLIKKEPIN
jgi:RHS repeat-associated protein